MPRPFQNRVIIDRLVKITTSDLINNNLLKANSCRSGLFTWKGSNSGTVTISINTRGNNSFMELSYKAGIHQIIERFELFSKVSNLGKGLAWYIICPSTRSKCKRLYLLGERFRGLKAIKNGIYSIQTKSKRQRTGIAYDIHRLTKIEKEIKSKGKGSKNFVSFYDGLPTKRSFRYKHNMVKKQILEKRLSCFESKK